MYKHIYIYVACILSHVQLFATPWTVAHQVPLSMGFPRQEYWSGLPFPIPGDLPEAGIEPTSPAPPALAGRVFTTSATWEAPIYVYAHTHTHTLLQQETEAREPETMGAEWEWIEAMMFLLATFGIVF